jgi:hypothetical protein
MSEPPPTPPDAPRTRLPVFLWAVGIVVLMIFALSLGGLAFWLVSRRPASVTVLKRASENDAVVKPPTLSRNAAASNEPVFTALFNGLDLSDWEFNPAVWSVRDGVIYGRSTTPSAIFWKAEEVEDFELRFRFRLTRGNSGIYYRARQLANFDVGGYEFEVFTNKTGNLADNGRDRERRRLYYPDPPPLPPLDTSWHEGVIIASGPRLIHQLDGQVLCDVEDTDSVARPKGSLALSTASGTTVEFKDLRFKRIGSPR